MKKIYGIFYFNYDEKELHSAYVSQELAERELRILDMAGKIGSGRIEEIRLCEDEGDLDEKPDTFEVQGTVENKMGRLNIRLYKKRLLYDNIEVPKEPYEVNFCLHNYKTQLYGFSILLPGSLIDSPNSETRRIIENKFPIFQEQFTKLLQNTRMRVNLRFIDDNSNQFGLRTQSTFNFLENRQKDLDVFEDIYYSNPNVASVYDRLCQKFREIVTNGFKEMLNKYMHRKADVTMLRAIKEDFADEASRFSWFDSQDPMNLDKCFQMFLMQGYIWNNKE